MPPVYCCSVALAESDGTLLDREPTNEQSRQESGFSGDHTTVLRSVQPSAAVGENFGSGPRRLTPLRAVLG
jgi:hypothetical protein